MKEKLNKSQSVSLLKKLTDVETVVNYKGDFVEMNVIGKLNQKKNKKLVWNQFMNWWLLNLIQ